jgi:23S rRNA (cytosine1962-C5)-methyltransferase
MPSEEDERVVVVSRRGAARLRSGHPWVYRSDLKSANIAGPGALVAVQDERGNRIGTALYSSASEIALRFITAAPLASHQELLALVRERIRSALEYRRRVVENSDAYRLVFSEADGLPGLIVDRYNDVLTLQALTQAMDQPAVKQAITTTLIEELAPSSVIERVDPRIRELEHLPPAATRPLYGERTQTVFTMNGVRFHYDAHAGQKTGAFLDQRENYAAAAYYARGEALDVFCYQGGFALHLARTCGRVTGVDSSRAALEAAEQNAALNGLPEMEWIEANAFDLLKDYATAGRQYDTIVIDPPAFARSKRTLPAALRGYKELNLRALKMLRSGGLLVTCSCSYHVSEADFLQMLTSAAIDSHRTLRLLERRGQAKDHPVVLTIPETSYLTCVLSNVNH